MTFSIWLGSWGVVVGVLENALFDDQKLYSELCGIQGWDSPSSTITVCYGFIGKEAFAD